jgi:DNA-binding NtrC family response regulator
MSATVLVVDDEANARLNINEYLTSKGYEVMEAGTLGEARGYLQKGIGDIILLDVNLPDGYGPTLLQETAHLPARPPIILITAFGDIDMAVDAMKNGALDFLQKPIQLVQLEKSVQRAVELIAMRRELEHLRSAQNKNVNFIIGSTPAMRNIIAMAERTASASVSVLITGETGSGKEVLANYIHRIGPRKNKSFIAINCAAIQNTMLESELFGYEAGAFTGAERRKIGLMEVADGGILFLDEISSMPMDIQAKLLRAIETRTFRRVGGTAQLSVDVQIVAASNRPLKQMLAEGIFREDLYYRLKVVDLHIPALRDRKADIPELVGFFLRHHNGHLGMNVIDVKPRAMDALIAYDWPGNIRELSNSIERAILFCDEESIDLAHLPSDVLRLTA